MEKILKVHYHSGEGFTDVKEVKFDNDFSIESVEGIVCISTDEVVRLVINKDHFILLEKVE